MYVALAGTRRRDGGRAPLEVAAAFRGVLQKGGAGLLGSWETAWVSIVRAACWGRAPVVGRLGGSDDPRSGWLSSCKKAVRAVASGIFNARPVALVVVGSGRVEAGIMYPHCPSDLGSKSWVCVCFGARRLKGAGGIGRGGEVPPRCAWLGSLVPREG